MVRFIPYCILLFTIFGSFACRTPNSRFRIATDEVSVPTDTAVPLDCQELATQARLGSITTRELCSSEDPASKAVCILASIESLAPLAGSARTPSPALNSIAIGQLCAQAAAAQVGECIRAARLATLGSNDTTTLCAGGSGDVKSCITASSEPLARDPGSSMTPAGPLNSLTISSICASAGPDLAGCITAARKAAMNSASAYTSCKSGGGGGGTSSACLAAASATLSKPEGATVVPSGPLGTLTAASLCSGKAGAGVADCITTARSFGFSDANTYTLCKTGDVNGALCIKAALRDMSAEASNGFVASMPLTSLNVIGICGPGNTSSGGCIEAGRLTAISSSGIAGICSKATAGTAGCIKAARVTASNALSESYTSSLCTAATTDTETCITQARADGKSTMTILKECKPSP